MTDDAPRTPAPRPDRRPGPDRKPSPEAAEREARLAEALRANLRRRKDRSRAAKAAPGPQAPDDEA